MRMTPLAILLVPGLLSAQAEITSAEIAKLGPRRYLNLRAQGLAGFRASIVPDWEYLLRQMSGKPEVAPDPEALRQLNGLHFTMTFAADGTTQVSHTADIAAPNAQVESGYKQIFDGMAQMVQGFFDTWRPFMMSSPFPSQGVPYTTDRSQPDWRLTYKEGATDIELTMTPALLIKKLFVKSSEFQSTLSPDFVKTDGGWALGSYKALYATPSGKNHTRLDVSIGYTTVEGFFLPASLSLEGSFEGSAFRVRVAFKDHVVQRAPSLSKAPTAAEKTP